MLVFDGERVINTSTGTNNFDVKMVQDYENKIIITLVNNSLSIYINGLECNYAINSARHTIELYKKSSMLRQCVYSKCPTRMNYDLLSYKDKLEKLLNLHYNGVVDFEPVSLAEITTSINLTYTAYMNFCEKTVGCLLRGRPLDG